MRRNKAGENCASRRGCILHVKKSNGTEEAKNLVLRQSRSSNPCQFYLPGHLGEPALRHLHCFSAMRLRACVAKACSAPSSFRSLFAPCSPRTFSRVAQPSLPSGRSGLPQQCKTLCCADPARKTFPSPQPQIVTSRSGFSTTPWAARNYAYSQQASHADRGGSNPATVSKLAPVVTRCLARRVERAARRSESIRRSRKESIPAYAGEPP